MTTVLRRIFAALTLGFALSLPMSAGADMGDWSSGPKEDADYTAAVKAIEAKDFDRAVELLNQAAARNDKDANVFNLLGYSERKRGNLDQAFKHYDRALTLDHKHLGANEYIGEAYLMVGDLAKAEEHLVKLDKLCLFGCKEYKELKEKIAEYKSKK
jgi:tetratricopeptide (TPR) repeat protein